MPVVAALRPGDDLADAVVRRPGELAPLERRREPAPAPVAADDRQPVLGDAVVVVRHQARVADDLAVGERDERALRAASPRRGASPRAGSRSSRRAPCRCSPRRARAGSASRAARAARRSSRPRPRRAAGRSRISSPRAAHLLDLAVGLARTRSARRTTCEPVVRRRAPLSRRRGRASRRARRARASSAVPTPRRRASGSTRGATKPRSGIVRAAAEPGADDLAVELGDEQRRSGRGVSRARGTSSTVHADSFGSDGRA